MRKPLLTVSIALAMSALTVNVAYAAAPDYSGADQADVFGDRMINLPIDESTVDSKSVTVWFKYIKDAYAYTYDLVGSGAAAADKACDGSDKVYEKKGMILAKDLAILGACGAFTTITKPGDEHGASPINGNVPLCEFTLPDLIDGNYAIAINPMVLGSLTGAGYSYQEKREGAACLPGSDDLVGGPITVAGWSGGLYNNGSLANDINYQLFSVADASPAATVVPMAIEPLLPLGGAEISPGAGNNFFVFTDDSGEVGRATWYELFVQDKDGVRVTDFTGDNTVHGQWFNIAADSTGSAPVGYGIDCVTFTPTATGLRTCTVTFDSAILQAAGQSPNDKYTWWVKGYNAVGHGVWSTTPGTFVGAP